MSLEAVMKLLSPPRNQAQGNSVFEIADVIKTNKKMKDQFPSFFEHKDPKRRKDMP